MNVFLNSHQDLIFGLVKILIMLGFWLNLAPVLVFVERRQSALIQDRVGPNRAMITVPGVALKGALATPALLGALLVAGLCFVVFPALHVEGQPTVTNAGRGFWLAEVATLLAWSHALVLAAVADGDVKNPLERFLADLEDPRGLFYLGLAIHAALLLVFFGFAGTPLGAQVFAYGGPAVLALVLLVIGAYMGYRIPSGPVELRAAGLLHSIADALKFAFKEDFVPLKADKLLHSLAPLISLFPAMVTYAIIPFGDTLCFEQTPEGLIDFSKPLAQAARAVGPAGACPGAGMELQIADLNVGILYLFAVAGTGIVGAAIAGWSSDNKWSLLGGLRAASQMVSYEVAMGLSLVGAFMIYGSPRLGDMVRWQGENCWGIFVQPVAFFLFFAAAVAEQKRTPFDAPEGESEIVAGYFLEYSSFKFAMFYTGEYMEMVTSSALLVAIFLGGWNLPFVHRDGLSVSFGDAALFVAPMGHVAVTILQILTFFGKVLVMVFGQMFIRWTLPRFRYDQIMGFGWKMLLPAAIANIVVTGLGILLIDQAGPSVVSSLRLLADATQAVTVLVVLGVVVRFAMLLLAPIDRHRFIGSSSAARSLGLGGTKESPMQA